MYKRAHSKHSRVEAGTPPNLPTDFVRITQPSVHVKHENDGQATVYKTYLQRPGSPAIAYQLDEGDHNVQPGDYDHTAHYSGVAGKHIYSVLDYD